MSDPLDRPLDDIIASRPKKDGKGKDKGKGKGTDKSSKKKESGKGGGGSGGSGGVGGGEKQHVLNLKKGHRGGISKRGGKQHVLTLQKGAGRGLQTEAGTQKTGAKKIKSIKTGSKVGPSPLVSRRSAKLPAGSTKPNSDTGIGLES
jgi:hypothetical protein